MKSGDLVTLITFGGVALLALLFIPKLLQPQNTTGKAVSNGVTGFLGLLSSGNPNYSGSPSSLNAAVAPILQPGATTPTSGLASAPYGPQPAAPAAVDNSSSADYSD